FAEHITALEADFPQHGRWIRCYGEHWEKMFAGHYPDSVAVLQRLARRGHRLHALSNYPAEKIAFLYRTFPFMQMFHTVVISGLLGVAKPDRAIFDYLLRLIRGRECLFIDDRPENVQAARRCGLRAVQYEARSADASLATVLSL